MTESNVKVTTPDEVATGDVISTPAKCPPDQYDEYNYDQDK